VTDGLRSEEIRQAPPVRRLLSDALVVAGISVFGYGLAFLHEAGYLRYFGLPAWLVQLDLSKVFVAVFGLLFVLWALQMVLTLVPLEFFAILHWMRALMFPGMLAFLTSEGVKNALHSDSWAGWLWPGLTGAATVYAVFLWLVEPIRSRPGQLSWTARLREAWIAEGRAMPETLLSTGMKSLSGRGYNAGLIYFGGFGLLVFSFVAYVAGKRGAATQQIFLVCCENPSRVALRSYGDHLLVGILDPAQRRVVGYLLEPMDREEPHDWRLVDLGRIEPADPVQAHPESRGTRWK
jgi:hypothetical protein